MERESKNQYQNFSASDFALDDSFIEWVKDGTPEACKFWNQWVRKHPEKTDTIKHARVIVLSMRFKGVSVLPAEIRHEWNKLQYNPSLDKKKIIPIHTLSHNSSQKIWLGIAASFILLVTFIFVTRQYDQKSVNEEKSPQMIVKKNPIGQKLFILLPDGTEIKLNSDSKLEYPKEFESDIREVKLEGEAFFDVTPNKNKPFIVHTKHVKTTVLGTSFNINAYTESPEVQIALVEGSVKVEATSNNIHSTETLLKPNEIVKIKTSDASQTISSFNPIEIAGWKDGMLYFEKTGFETTISKLERWYGVQFEVEEGTKINPNWTFNGSFKNRSLEYVLNTFSYPDLFGFSIQGKRVIIKPYN